MQTAPSDNAKRAIFPVCHAMFLRMRCLLAAVAEKGTVRHVAAIHSGAPQSAIARGLQIPFTHEPAPAHCASSSQASPTPRKERQILAPGHR